MMRAADDFEAINAAVQELRKANAPKPRCPRHDGGFCNQPCKDQSDCYIEWQRANATPSGDFC